MTRILDGSIRTEDLASRSGNTSGADTRGVVKFYFLIEADHQRIEGVGAGHVASNNRLLPELKASHWPLGGGILILCNGCNCPRRLRLRGVWSLD
jgi:hypothetical protein